MFADLHSHPTFRPFNDLRNSGEDVFTNPGYTIWGVTHDNKKAIAQGKRAAAYAQANVSRLLRGKVKLVYASLYPIEQGFFLGNPNRNYNKKHVNLIARNWKKTKFNLFLSSILNGTLGGVVRLLVNGGVGRDIANSLFMKFSLHRINFLQGETEDKHTGLPYQYFDELRLEYEFIHRFADVACPDIGNDGASLGCYRIVKDRKALERSFSEPREVALVLTIEGGHPISLNQAKQPVQSEREMNERINWIKGHGIFFLTFAHHFDNRLCGHARSLPRFSNIILDQEGSINTGFSALGWRVIRRLLSIDENNNYQPELGRRVLIDVKHMSSQARKEFYSEIITPYNQDRLAGNADIQNRKIPVIASHVGYSGRKTFEEVAQNLDQETDDNSVLSALPADLFKQTIKAKGFYGWNINICDEDVRAIHQSEGLIGISFDQRVIGDLTDKKSLEALAWAKLFLINTLSCVEAVIQSDLMDKPSIWKRMTIGTDFDGMIDPINTFATSEEFGLFRKYLTEALHDISDVHQSHYFINHNPFTVDEVVDMITHKNMYAFTLQHLE
jgi:microsomal dipeptidase-like Zn-dependent dipeptidase